MANPILFDEQFGPAVSRVAHTIADNDIDRWVQLRLTTGAGRMLSRCRVVRHDDSGTRRDHDDISGEIRDFVKRELAIVSDAPLGQWVYFVVTTGAVRGHTRSQRQFRAMWRPETREHRLSLDGEHRLGAAAGGEA